MSEAPNSLGGRAGQEAILDDAKAFQKGKGRMLAAMILAVVATLGAFAWYLVQDQPNPYGELGKQVNGLRSAHFERFWHCVLPNQQMGVLKSDTDMREALHSRGVAGARYGEHLRDKCRDHLADLSPKLRALITPDDASPHVRAMADAARKLRSGAEAYASHLLSLSGGYDKEAAEPHMEQLVRGWYEFRRSHAELNQLIKSKLQG